MKFDLCNHLRIVHALHSKVIKVGESEKFWSDVWNFTLQPLCCNNVYIDTAGCFF